MDFDRLDLDTVQLMIHNQAVLKQWQTKSEYMIERAYQELKELELAISGKKSSLDVAKEVIDVMYFIFQALYDVDHKQSLNEAFQIKYDENWINKKKTIDEKGRPVLR